MDKNSSVKKCPFCKNQIPINSEKCPVCKTVIIERIEFDKKNPQKKLENTIINEESRENLYNENKVYNLTKKGIPFKTYEFIKKKKVALIIIVIGLLIIFYFNNFYEHDDSEEILFNTELKEDKPADNKPFSSNNNINPHFEADKQISNNNKIQDFTNIPEKFVANGKIFRINKNYFKGLGELSVKNGTSNDAVLKLVSTIIGKSILTIYVRRNSNYTIKKIKDGNYKLYFVTGRHYDEDSSVFLQDCSFSEFSDDFLFYTIKEHLADKIRTDYSVFEITLHMIPGGTARTNAITKKKFLIL